MHRVADCSVNVYLGLRYLLNTIHLLHTSKYSQITTVIFAVLFLGLGAAGFYFSIFKSNLKLGLLIALGPWVLGLAVLFIRGKVNQRLVRADAEVSGSFSAFQISAKLTSWHLLCCSVLSVCGNLRRIFWPPGAATI
jgi:hypothetical protein